MQRDKIVQVARQFMGNAQAEAIVSSIRECVDIRPGRGESKSYFGGAPPGGLATWPVWDRTDHWRGLVADLDPPRPGGLTTTQTPRHSRRLHNHLRTVECATRPIFTTQHEVQTRHVAPLPFQATVVTRQLQEQLPALCTGEIKLWW